MKSSEKLFVLAVLLAAPAGVRAGFVSYTDEAEWRAAASLVGTGVVHEIDFETLPDGSPSVAFTPITSEFNYTDQGVTFSSPFPELEIQGDPGLFVLSAMNPDTSARNWIRAHFQPSAFAVGIIIGSGRPTLFAFDQSATLIGEVTYDFGEDLFVGIVSPTPILWMTQDDGHSAVQDMQSLFFTPVPEPSTLLLLGAGTAYLFVRSRGRRRAPGLNGVTESNPRCKVRLLAMLFVFVALYGPTNDATSAQTQTWTTTAEFTDGYPINSQGVADGADGSLAIRTSPETLPYMWVACSSRGTVVRIATAGGEDPVTGQPITRGQVLGEYLSAPTAANGATLCGRDPSRTTVDFDGSVWLGNRANNPG